MQLQKHGADIGDGDGTVAEMHIRRGGTPVMDSPHALMEGGRPSTAKPASTAFSSCFFIAARTIASIRVAASSTVMHRPEAATWPAWHSGVAGAGSDENATAIAQASNAPAAGLEA